MSSTHRSKSRASDNQNDIGSILYNWNKAKKELEHYENKIKKYKLEVMREMNRLGVETLAGGGFSVTRRRMNRDYLTKENVPKEIWKEYATRSSYDAYYLVKK